MMKSLSVTIPLLIVSSFGWISAQNILHLKSNVDSWLNIDLSDLSDNCKLKEKESIIDRLINDYEESQVNFLLPVELEDMEESNFVMHYIYNSDMINKLKELIKGIQNCLDDKDRLDSEGVAEVMGQILKSYAMKMANVEPMSEKDIMCFRIEQGPNACNHLLPKNGFFLGRKLSHILKFEIIKNSTCEENLPSLQCTIKEFKNCSPKLKTLVKVLLSPAEVGICNNYVQEEEPEIEDIGEEINEEISDLFKEQKEKYFSFKKFLRL